MKTTIRPYVWWGAWIVSRQTIGVVGNHLHFGITDDNYNGQNISTLRGFTTNGYVTYQESNYDCGWLIHQ